MALLIFILTSVTVASLQREGRSGRAGRNRRFPMKADAKWFIVSGKHGGRGRDWRDDFICKQTSVKLNITRCSSNGTRHPRGFPPATSRRCYCEFYRGEKETNRRGSSGLKTRGLRVRLHGEPFFKKRKEKKSPRSSIARVPRARRTRSSSSIRGASADATFIAENTLATKHSPDNLERIKGGGMRPVSIPEDRVFMLMHTGEKELVPPRAYA